jgi:hypothetical protein
VEESVLGDASRLISLSPDATDAEVTEAITALKGRLPALFASQQSPPPPSGEPGGTPPRQQPSGDAFQRGAERAKALLGGAVGAA